MEAASAGPSRLRMPEYRRGHSGRDLLSRGDAEAGSTPCASVSRAERQGRSSMAGRFSCGGYAAEDSTPLHGSSCRNLAGGFSDAADSGLAGTATLQRSGHIRVAVRVRPLPVGEDGIIEVASSGAIAIRKDAATGGNEFLRSQQGRVEERAFDHVFDPLSSQKEVYTWGAAPLLSEAIAKGRSATVFVYGATGAGKTHTMFGGCDSEQQGIIFRAIPEVFQLIADRQAESEEADGRLEVKVSFLEIYNEVVRDLLQENGGGGQCRVLEDERRGVVKVANLVEAHAQTADEALWYLRAGMQARTVEATAANSQSSRAHAVFSLTIEQVKQASQGQGPFANLRNSEVRSLHSKISLIDLAGSERASFTQNTGSALKDGARINQSLLALANCIDALTAHRHNQTSTPRKKPPYRDSKLTLMLKGSLTGDGMVSMIANVHPGRSHFEDSNNTLEYAKRASTVRPATNRRVSRAAPVPSSAVQEDTAPDRLQGGRPAWEEGCALGTSSSSTLPHRADSADDRLKRSDSAPDTTCPEECLSEISLGSGFGGAESHEDAVLTEPKPSSVKTPSSEKRSDSGADAEASVGGCSGSVSPPCSSRSVAVSDAADESASAASIPGCCQTTLENEDAAGHWHALFGAIGRGEANSDEATTLSVALKLIDRLQSEKVQFDSRLKKVALERDGLLEARRELENENEQLRAANLEKDKQIALLLNRCSDQFSV
eukprot:gb/GFBE01078698.1/.p1 GENE.gb/GFBE01078698.1/~~gb/GFBE01078698.1/.p1  ORF type:complete len:719 (+),score=148.17 gb/GFBE01078698.1/:1-2157(+)